MKISRYSLYWRWFLSSVIVCILLGGNEVDAQVPVTDGTTGTVVNPLPGSEFEIRGGTAAGRNLFHSFDQFSVPNAGRVIFFNDNGAIKNVLNRVTGTSTSRIDGMITTAGLSPNFNLFLLNPNGILFGPGGELNIGGSFLVSTGQGIQFGNQGVFSTVPAASTDPTLLTIDPSALLFNQIAAAQPRNAIEVNGSFLSVPARQNLVLLGGNAAPTATATGGVFIDGALLDAQSGRVEVGAVGGGGSVALSSNFELIFPQDLPKADIVLQNALPPDPLVDVGDRFGGPGGGTARIQGSAVSFTDAVIFAGNTIGGQGGGGIIVRAEQLTLDNSKLLAISDSAAAGGDVVVDVSQGIGQLELRNNSTISSEAVAMGSGGSLSIQANQIKLFSGSGVGTETRGDGNAGAVTIAAQTLELNDGFIASNTFGTGNGGRILINDADRIDLLGRSQIAANADDLNPVTGNFVSGVGSAGEIKLMTNQLNIQDGAQIAASTLGDSGAGGKIRLEADTVNLNGPGSRLVSQVDFGSPSPGGTIEIDARVLRLQDGAQISTSTQDRMFLGTSGDAGDIFIRNAELVEIIGGTEATGLFAQVGDSDTGPAGITGAGGRINLSSGQLRLIGDGARISSSTFDLGAGGNITITAEGIQVRDGAQIQAVTSGLAPGGQITASTDVLELLGTSSAAPFFPSALVTTTLGDAPAGDITVTSNTLSVQAGARLSASSDGAGAGGTIRVTAAEQVNLVGRGNTSASGLFVEGRGSGTAGNVELVTPLLRLNQGQVLSTTVSDDGGDIRLQVPQLLRLENNALISATAVSGSGLGNGGNISIDTPYIVAQPLSNSDIVANAFLGQGGKIQISARGLFQIAPRLAILGNDTNDIDASSEFGTNGTVAITQPDIDPNQALNDVTPDFVDVSRLIVQGCQPRGTVALNRLTITGRGGIALNPVMVPSSGRTFTDLGTITTAQALPVQSSSQKLDHPPTNIPNAPNQMVEAQDWVMDEQGNVILVAQAPAAMGADRWQASSSCGN